MSSRFKGFTRVASSYDAMEIRMAVAALDGAGITSITPGIRLNETIPFNSLAFGPVEVLVPDTQADEAAALLQAVADGTVIPHDQRDLDENEGVIPAALEVTPTIGDKLKNLLGFLIAGVSSPVKGLSIDRNHRKDR